MGKQKFIDKMKDMFGMEEEKEISKKKSIKELIAKLEAKREELKIELKVCKSKKEQAEIKESIAIIDKQIKKGQKLL